MLLKENTYDLAFRFAILPDEGNEVNQELYLLTIKIEY